MFGHGWRPLTVAMLTSGALFLPPGVAEAALPGASAAGAVAAGSATVGPAVPAPRAATSVVPGPRTAVPAPRTTAPAVPGPRAATPQAIGPDPATPLPVSPRPYRPTVAPPRPRAVPAPPVTTPPVTTPPVTTPPVTAPPVAAPPVTAPPLAAPPVTTPPAAVPPAPSAAPAPPAPGGAAAAASCSAIPATSASAAPSAGTSAAPGGLVGAALGAAGRLVDATEGVLSSVLGTLPAAAGVANLPGDLLKLGDWYLTLPTGQQGSPDTIQGPHLSTFTNEFFRLNPTRNGVVFSARGDGVTTKNSHYPRSELREMDGDKKASWTNTTGSHTLDVCEAITKVPATKPEVVSAQIHDDKDDVLQIRLEGQKLMVQYHDGSAAAVLDPAYRLGTPFNVRIVAADSKVGVSYNGQHKADLPLAGAGWYWKVGAYVQSNPTKGDTDSVGEVVVYSIDMTHS